MQHLIVITIPAAQRDLSEEVRQELAPYARVNQLPPALDLAQTQMIIEIVATTVSIVVNATAIYEFILRLKDRKQNTSEAQEIKIGSPGGESYSLSDIDDSLLRHLLGLTEDNGPHSTA